MEMKIGLIHTAREIEIEIDDDVDTVAGRAEHALQGGERMIWFTDNKGHRIGVVAERLSYIECSDPETQKVVGFSG